MNLLKKRFHNAGHLKHLPDQGMVKDDSQESNKHGK